MEAKKALVRKNIDGSAEFARTVITNIVYFVSGVLVSKGAMLGNLSPFGASFAAAVPKKYLLYKVAYKRHKASEKQRSVCSADCVFADTRNRSCTYLCQHKHLVIYNRLHH